MPMEISYEGGKRFKASTRNLELICDQPLNEGGADQGFTPPELLIASLGTCIGVYIEGFATRHEVDVTGMKINLTWEKVKDPVRLGKIHCAIDIPAPLTPQLKASFLKVAEQCLIHNTLSHAPEITVELNQ